MNATKSLFADRVADSDVFPHILDAYLPDVKSPLYNVFNHPAGHGNLPPAYIQVCGSDPLRDEGLLYEEILSTESKVKTRLDVYQGLPHHFWQFFPDFPGNVKHTQDTIAGLKWLLGQGN